MWVEGGGGIELERRGGVVTAELGSTDPPKGCGGGAIGGAGSDRGRVGIRCGTVTPPSVRGAPPPVVDAAGGSPCVWCAPCEPSCVTGSGGIEAARGAGAGGGPAGSRTPVVALRPPPDVVTCEGPPSTSSS